ncbi:MAG TPA: hypothetical protein VFC78_23430 [Tepidisphaeraceae bacterium]|nr:hypothetical protein [Tepidisphaeraceae bacterium]
MTLQNETELANTRIKLAELEKRLDELRHDAHEDPRVRDLTLRSLKWLINQMKEEITRFGAHQPAH